MLQMDDERPDPQQFLAEVKPRRGNLKIFFGAFAGVGKTYAMLMEAQQLRKQGVDVIAGVIETHGRKETTALLYGLEVIPLKKMKYQKYKLFELDIDRVLARSPSVVLIDELAHNNVSGSRHEKRWQDIDELLEAGITVYTTLNVQHLESLNDVVGGITKIRVQETIPDRIFNSAYEVILVDLPPNDLRQRMTEGKIYLPSRVGTAIDNFFNKGNLTALRELALRCTADCIDEQRRLILGKSYQPDFHDSILVCLNTFGNNEKLIRVGVRLARQLKSQWHVVYVETPKLHNLPNSNRYAILDELKLAEKLGAETAILGDPNPEQALVRYAQRHNLGKIVLARTTKFRWWKIFSQTLVSKMSKLAPDLDFITIALTSIEKVEKVSLISIDKHQRQLPAILVACGLCILTTTISLILFHRIDHANIIMLYMLATVGVAWRFSQRIAMLAAFINVFCFNWFFVEPYHSFTVNNLQYLLTFIVMLIVGTSITRLTHSSRHQAKISRHREERTRQLFELTKILSKAEDHQEIIKLAAMKLNYIFQANVKFILIDENNNLKPDNNPDYDMAIVSWCFNNQKPAGIGTDTLPSSDLFYQPLFNGTDMMGVAVIKVNNPRLLMIPEQIRLLHTCALLIAQSLERVRSIKLAELAKISVETEKMRSTMLSSLSHDLRTPLTVLLNQIESLHQKLHDQPELATQSKEIVNQVNTTIALSNNVMDMIRLEATGFTLQKDWQDWGELISASLSQFPQYDNQISVALDNEIPLVSCDALLIQRVLVNLLENAFKYAGSNAQVELQVYLDGGWFKINVIDNGPGIELGKEKEIFQKFYRGGKESKITGLGLGLAISEAIIIEHEGYIISYNSNKGGAVFSIRLPYYEVPTIPDDI